MRVSFLILGLALISPGFAQSDGPINTDRPGFSDGSNIVPVHVFQIESGTTRSYQNGLSTQTLPDTEFRYGLFSGFELRAVNLTYGFAPGPFDSFLDPNVGFKIELQKPKGNRGQISFVAETSVPVGAANLRTNNYNPSFRIAWSTPLGIYTLNGNFILSRINATDQRFYQSAATINIGESLNARTTLSEELYFRDHVARFQGGGVIADAFITHLLSNSLQLDFTVGIGLNEARDGWFTAAGVSIKI